jgi:hypothetical protein
MASSFLIQIIVFAASLQKTGSFARNWPLAHAKFASVWLCHACASGQLRAKPPVFASMLREQLFELKNEDAIKNLRIYETLVLAKAYQLTLCMAKSPFLKVIRYMYN